MRSPKKQWFGGGIVIAGMLGLAIFSAADSGENPTVSPETVDTVAAAQTPEEEVKAAMKDLIATVEKRDFRRLFEFYMPVEALRELRRGPGVKAVAEQAAKRAETRKGQLEEFVKPFREALKTKPSFNRDNTEATFQIVITPARTVSASRVPILAVRNADPKITGYGPDLKAVIAKSTADLENNKLTDYFQKMLPVSELKLNKVEEIAKRFKASPASVKQAIADLKSLKDKKPKFEDDGKTAVFTIPVPVPKPIRRRGRRVAPVYKVPPRVFKFQKVGGHWRLYDNTTKLQMASKGFSRKIPAETKTLRMEKIGNGWRIADDSEYGGGKSTSRKSYSRSYKTESKTFERRRFREKTEPTKTERR